MSNVFFCSHHSESPFNRPWHAVGKEKRRRHEERHVSVNVGGAGQGKGKKAGGKGRTAARPRAQTSATQTRQRTPLAVQADRALTRSATRKAAPPVASCTPPHTGRPFAMTFMRPSSWRVERFSNLQPPLAVLGSPSRGTSDGVAARRRWPPRPCHAQHVTGTPWPRCRG